MKIFQQIFTKNSVLKRRSTLTNLCLLYVPSVVSRERWEKYAGGKYSVIPLSSSFKHSSQMYLMLEAGYINETVGHSPIMKCASSGFCALIKLL